MIRHAKLAAPWLALYAATSALAAPQPVDVRLSAAQPVLQGDVSVGVEVTVTNTSDRAVKILKSQLPSQHLQGPLFRVIKEDGSPAPYIGPLVKRAAPRAEDYVRLEAGAALTYHVDLTRHYELGNGRYTVEYLARNRHADEATLTSSAPLALWTSGRSMPAETVALAQPEAADITYTGGCTSTEKKKLVKAVNVATNYATESNAYLAGTPSGTQRYVKWFGAFSASRWNTVHTHFTNEENAFKTKPLTLDCSCNDKGVYAYVYANQPYKIYLCGAFWSAPMKGTDSKGGTLVHEMSHFTVVAGTGDWAYGQAAAANLAKSNPDKAVDNADSHEYFAENNPSLP
ncbi:M35 family metallo-endopeptidase [Ideonella sp. DXS29W]|uniref:M35 family metallo-endopeptidase n=1 Tax=Ideonella lacteola TaxID=2984193 RepID=A0ABU9BQB9_9BURK